MESLSARGGGGGGGALVYCQLHKMTTTNAPRRKLLRWSRERRRRSVPSVLFNRPQPVLVDVRRDTATETISPFLIETEVNPAVDSRVVDVVADRVERVVVQRDVGD